MVSQVYCYGYGHCNLVDCTNVALCNSETEGIDYNCKYD